MNKRINSGLITSCLPLWLLATTTVALAEGAYDPPPNQSSPTTPTTSTSPTGEYKPPDDQSSPTTRTTPTGSRGNCPVVSKQTPLTVLAPKESGRTVSSHPTFAWFVHDKSTLSIKFRLLEYGSDKSLKVVHEIKFQSSPGIMKLSLPEYKPGLALGKRYRWQVRVICDPDHPSNDLVAEAEIELVEKPQLKNALSAAKNHLEIAQLYEKSGIWYDALSEALKNPEDLKLKQFAATLLEDLSKLEEPKQRANLRQVVVSQ